MDQIIVETTSTAGIAIALFGVALCLTQTDHSRVRRSFSIFLATVAIIGMPDAFTGAIDLIDRTYIQWAELIIWGPSVLCLAPLFWLYVCALTATDQGQHARPIRHLLLPALALLVGFISAVLSPQVGAALYSNGPIPTSGWPLVLLVFVVLFQMAQYPQMGIYLFLIVRRMLRFRLMLRDYYASTEEHELRWIFVIGGLAAVFWFGRALLLVLAFDPEMTATPPNLLSIAAVSSLALIAAMTLWGLRQRPPLIPDATALPQTVEATPPTQPVEKYEKSALSPEASARIARKLRSAMEQDHLHRDPNLSLWVLARHIGASPNYISQTLSEVIGESFFDFVNGYRIEEAKSLLATTNETVLAITYEVGFNARSSFYNAFKRVTGETPSSYRKTLSRPVGLDDRDA